MNFMDRALKIAKKGEGMVSPNPVVGAVIVKENKIIAEGYHKKFGGAHAEVEAFNQAKLKDIDVDKAEMYITLEPCSHYGKTPPCADLIIKNKISKVYVAMLDPNPLVAGKGVKKLREAGIEVIVGEKEREAKKLNEVFVKYITQKIPFVTLKSAMTLDGKIATHTGNSKWISSEKSREFVHKMRNKNSAIMVGIGTVLKDDPSLTTRLEGGKDAVRIVIDKKCEISIDSKILNLKSEAKTIIAIGEDVSLKKIKSVEEKGAEVIKVKLKGRHLDLNDLMIKLGKLNIDSVLLEGGGSLNYSAVKQGIVDKLVVFVAPKLVGGDKAKTFLEGRGIESVENGFNIKNMKSFFIDKDIVIEGYLKEGE